MPENFNMIPNNKIDVGKIANLLVMEKTRRKAQNKPILMHLLMALASAVCIYFAIDGMSFGFAPILLFAVMCAGPALGVYTLLYSPLAIKVVQCLLPIVLFAVRFVAEQPSSLSFNSAAARLFSYIICMLCCIVMAKTVISMYTKNTCFLLVCAVYVIVFLCIAAFIVVSLYGSFGIGLTLQALDGFFDNLIEQTVASLNTPHNLNVLHTAYEGFGELTDEELLESFRQALEFVIPIIKMCLPAIVIVTCMAFAFVTVEIFSVVAKKLNIPVFVCIMDDFWSYRPSTVTTVFYDMVFFAFIIGMFVSLPQNVSATIINLLLIMTPAMLIFGIKGIYEFLYKKNKNKAKSKGLTFVIVLAAFMIMSTYSMLVIASLGVMFITNKNRQELAALPAKMLADNLTYESLYGKNSNDENKTDEGGEK